MSTWFVAEQEPDTAAADAVAALAPENPFGRPAFAAARLLVGDEPWLLTVRDDDRITAGCYGFLRRGRLSCGFNVHSLPLLPEPEVFWTGLLNFCRRHRVTELHINTFASRGCLVPPIGRELDRRPRREYHLDLTQPSVRQGMSSNHQRNIKRAARAGVMVERQREPAGAETHARAISQSMQRREARGEDVSTEASARPFQALVETGSGELYQATLDGQVLSSLLILRATTGAYYHSAGTFPEGMEVGAAHYLVSTVAEDLREEGLVLFNLSGAGPEEEGLARFKAGFGAQAVELEAASFDLAASWQRALIRARRRLGR